jgi:hypothetical protein
MIKNISLALLLGILFNTHAQNSVTFRVNLKQAIIENQFSESNDDIVVVRGNFEGWQSNEYKLTDNNKDSIYSGTFIFREHPGSEIEYKYVIVNSVGEEDWEWRPNPDNPPYGNRKLSLTGKPQIIPPEDFDVYLDGERETSSQTLFSVIELQDDFNQLRSVYEKEHCCLYEYTSKEKFDSLFDHQYKSIDHPMQYHEFFQILAPINNYIGCMHSSIWMPNQFWEQGKEKLLPLQIELIEGYAVVSGYYNDTTEVPIGSIILEVNTQPIDGIIDRISKSYSADGLNKQFQLAQVEKRFPMAYARIYGFSDKYEITFALPGRKTKETVQLTPADLSSVRAVVFKSFSYPPLTIDLLEEKKTAVIKISSFIYYDRVDYFKAFLDSAFLEIKDKQIENLILDLRGNDGGDPFCAIPLLSYLENEPVQYFIREYGKYAELVKLIPLSENHFSGNLFTLIDKRCGSTNGHFCALLKYHKIGKLVGSEGGATYKCNARTKEVILDNTKIMVYVAQETYAVAVEGMDKTKGVQPDYFVEQTYKDFLNGKDTVIELTLELIKINEE